MISFSIGDITLTSVAQAKAALAQAKAQVAIAVGNLQISQENFRHDVGEYPGDLTPPQPLDLAGCIFRWRWGAGAE